MIKQIDSGKDDIPPSYIMLLFFAKKVKHKKHTDYSSSTIPPRKSFSVRMGMVPKLSRSFLYMLRYEKPKFPCCCMVFHPLNVNGQSSLKQMWKTASGHSANGVWGTRHFFIRASQ